MKKAFIGVFILCTLLIICGVYDIKTHQELTVEKIEWIKKGYQQGYLDGVKEAHKVQQDSSSYKSNDIDNSFIKFILKKAKL